jgi:hypothetical protein
LHPPSSSHLANCTKAKISYIDKLLILKGIFDDSKVAQSLHSLLAKPADARPEELT